MNVTERIERALDAALAAHERTEAPGRLAAAVRHAVFPGGARIRPQLCLAVAAACGEDDLRFTDATLVALELLHCASLVHDDLSCFDDADVRRGRPSVKAAFGEALAVLAGDALIVRAFEVLGEGAAASPARLAPVLATIARGVGAPGGIVAGQAWECEPKVSLSVYQQAKTGALFAAATVAGAQSAGADGTPWRLLGERLGEAYQIADDIRDVLSDPAVLGKPTGQDAALGRPSSAHALGLVGAIRHFEAMVAGAVDAIPACRGAARLRALVRAESERLVPHAWCEDVARRLAA